MKINLIIPSNKSITTLNDGSNVQGDEMIARGWQKYLNLNPKISLAEINGNNSYDVSISFNPTIKNDSGKLKVLYFQNVFPKPYWPGTIEVFNLCKNNYHAYIFPSEKLMQQCNEGLVCPFAVDEDLYKPTEYEKDFAHNIVFVGNNIRGDEINNRYIYSVKDKGLLIYGNPNSWNNSICKGKISLANEAKTYTHSKICLNAHNQDHLDFEVFNYRIFTILACKGFIISDRSESLEKEFRDSLVFTDGYDDLADKCDFYLANPEKVEKFKRNGYDLVLSKHTFKHRINNLVNWLETKI